MILLALWRRGLLGRIDREKLDLFLGRARDPLQLSRRYPLWRRLGIFRMLLSPAHVGSVSSVLE